MRSPAPGISNEDVANFCAVAVDCRNQDVARRVVAQLNDQFGQIGLDRGDAVCFEVLVEPDFPGGHRLDFDHFGDRVGGAPAARTMSVTIRLASSASAPSGPRRARLDVALELPQQLQVAELSVSRFSALPAAREFLPVGAFTHGRNSFA